MAENYSSRSNMLRQKRVQSAPSLKPGLTSMAGPGARRSKPRKITQAPVVSRRGVAGASSSRRVSNVSRRRYDIALNIPGAEIRLPAVPQVRIGWRLISGVLTAMMLASLYMMFFTPFFEVAGVEVAGAQRLTSTDINLELGLIGETIFAVDPAEVQQRLEAEFPEVATYELAIGLPHTIALSIEERTPVLSWNQDGKEIWVDAEGIGFSPRGEVEGLLGVHAEGLPLGAELVGSNMDLVLKPELVATTLAMQAYLPEGAELMYEQLRGFGWRDQREWVVYFGHRIEDIDQKLATYQTLVDILLQQGIKPALISVEYLHAPYYRLEP